MDQQANLDSSGYFGDRTVESYYYDNSDDKTFLRYNFYPSDIVSSGSPVLKCFLTLFIGQVMGQLYI